MSKISYEVIRAWKQGNAYKMSNTRTNGVVVYLHDNAIIKREGNRVFIRTAGYPTKTTKSRLNELDGVRVNTSRGEVYLNGEVWENHKDWTQL
jgi:hypothetical protein